MSTDAPDLSLILGDLYIGNLAAAKSLHERPELGITHILSVCPEYPEAEEARKGATISAIASQPSVQHPAHRCISIEDSEFEDILTHLPAAVAFIRDALEPCQTIPGEDDGQQTSAEKRNSKQVAELRVHNNSCTRSAQKHKVLVHCVMGISRSTTVVCAYLMATRQLSFPAALMFIRKRRPRVHPNYGFRRQLQIFGECNYLKNYPAPVQTHPAFTAWQRKRRREVCRYLSRIEDAIEIKLDDEDEPQLAIADDFPTDPLEASSLLSEVGATHFLSISPASLPSLSSAPPSTASRRPSGPCPILSSAWSSRLSPDSTVSSPLSSRSSSFSSRFSPPISGPSTAATSVLSLPSVVPLSKLRTEASSSESDSEDDTSIDPSYLELAGVEHHHLAIPDSDSSSLLFHLSDAASFINRSLNDDDTSSSSESNVDVDLNLNLNIEDRKFIQRKHVLIHCTTENRACAVVCAYLMCYKGLTPRQAYDVLERALPLFNLTRSFANLLELFHDCGYNPTVDHPLVHKWLSGAIRSVLPSSSLSSSSSSTATGLSAKSLGVRNSTTTHWNVESDTEGDAESMSLRRKLGTPMRCGSFSTHYSHSNANANAGQGQKVSTTVSTATSASTANTGRHPHPRPHPSSAAEGMDLEGLLHRFQGVGDPNFAFDVEAFRGAICAAAGGNAKVMK